MIRYGAQRACPNQGLGASGLRGPEPKCKSINQSNPPLPRLLHPCGAATKITPFAHLALCINIITRRLN